VNPASYYLWAGLAVLVLAISKTGFGGGGIGILSIPLMAMAMPQDAQRLIAVLGILFVVVDFIANLHYLGQYDWSVLKWLLPGAVAGVGLGLWILLALRGSDPAFNRHLSLAIGCICLVVVAMQVLRSSDQRVRPALTGPGSGLPVGCVAGAASTIAHAAGPIVTLYLLQQRVDRKRLVGTLLLYTFLINTVKLAGYVGTGVVTRATMKETLWMLPILPAGTLAGAWMHRKLPEKPFVIIMYAAAAIAAGQMIWKGL
jgi:uncharacterized membrane protein YfcA